MTESLARSLVKAYLSEIESGIGLEKRNGFTVVSVPFETSGGHLAEVFVTSLLDSHLRLSDLGEGIGDLVLSGLPLAAARKAARDAAQLYGLEFTEDALSCIGKADNIGELLHRMVQALVFVGHAESFAVVPSYGGDKLERQLRSVLSDVDWPKYRTVYRRGSAAKLGGRVGTNHQLDAVFLNGNVTALKLIDARRTKDLRMRAEAWTWAFTDIKQGGQAERSLAVYDGGNRLWTDELTDIVKSGADAFVQLEDRDGIVAAITAK